MSFRRVSGLAGMMLAMMFWGSCGQVYRPVVIPIAVTPPNSQNYHAVFGLSTNAASNPGAALQIDVSGDTEIGQANMGVVPTHGISVSNNARVFVASAGSLFPGQSDVVTSFTPAFPSSVATGLTQLTTFTYPNVGPLGSNGVPTWSCSYLPDFIASIQFTAVFVANYGVEGDPKCAPNPSLPNGNSTDSVFFINATNGTIANIAYLPAGSHPVAMAETPNAQNLYVANQGTNSVVDLSPLDLSFLVPPSGIGVGTVPVWVVARADNQRVYVLTQGSGATSGAVVPIDTVTNTVLASQTNLSVGVGADFMLYDPHLNRLYVTNPTNGNVYVFSTSGGVDPSGTPNDTPTLLGTISMTTGANPPCQSQSSTPVTCAPVSVAALPDGTRFYVASYEYEAACPDGNVVNPDGSAAPCVIPRLTVFDAASLALKTPTASLLPQSLSLLTTPQFAANQYAAAQSPSCITPATYMPGTTRFRMFTSASTDSSHVYVSICDARTIADVATNTNTISTGGNSPDTLRTDVLPAFSLNVGASITSFSISNNIVTFQSANTFYAGESVTLQNLSAGSYLNGLTLTVRGTGLSGTQFSCDFTHADVGATVDSGTATSASPVVPQTPTFLLTGQ